MQSSLCIYTRRGERDTDARSFPPLFMHSKSPLCTVGYVLMAVGAINWGLVAALNFNLVEALLGTWPMVVKIVYILVGLSGVAGLVCMAKCAGKCGCAGGSCGCG